jgi:hypothetical protein
VPTALQAALDWPWWLGLALCLLGLVALVRASRNAARKRGLTSVDEGPQWIVRILGPASAPVALTIVEAAPERYWGLALPTFMLTFGLIEGWLWRRYDQRISPPRSLDPRAR